MSTFEIPQNKREELQTITDTIAEKEKTLKQNLLQAIESGVPEIELINKGFSKEDIADAQEMKPDAILKKLVPAIHEYKSNLEKLIYEREQLALARSQKIRGGEESVTENTDITHEEVSTAPSQTQEKVGAEETSADLERRTEELKKAYKKLWFFQFGKRKANKDEMKEVKRQYIQKVVEEHTKNQTL